MAWVPDPSLASLVARLTARRKDRLGEQTQSAKGVIQAELSARGTLLSGNYIHRIKQACADALKEYADGLTADVMEIVQRPDGSIEPEAAAWVREQLEPNFEALAQGTARSIQDDRIVQQLRVPVMDDMAGAAAVLKRDLEIALDKATLRRGTNPRSELVIDPALMDTLVSLRNRRAFDADLTELLSCAKASIEPLALVVFDIDKFKRVNDDHGGHATGDEALLAVATISSACAKGKGTAYRIGGDEFAIIFPNHSTPEAVAVAERLRRTVHGTPLTSRALTISLSIGVAEFPVHGGDATALKKAADAAAYDGKNLGRNLVRVFGEPPPINPGAREPERKQPAPGSLTEDQRKTIRQDYFRRRVANCPIDGALLNVQDTTALGQKTASIYVTCPLCGLSEELA